MRPALPKLVSSPASPRRSTSVTAARAPAARARPKRRPCPRPKPRRRRSEMAWRGPQDPEPTGRAAPAFGRSQADAPGERRANRSHAGSARLPADGRRPGSAPTSDRLRRCGLPFLRDMALVQLVEKSGQAGPRARRCAPSRLRPSRRLSWFRNFRKQLRGSSSDEVAIGAERTWPGGSFPRRFSLFHRRKRPRSLRPMRGRESRRQESTYCCRWRSRP